MTSQPKGHNGHANPLKDKRIINDFTIEAATVNGSGSQTANLVLAKSIINMGIPVGPKNIFPSNIQGLPTWYIMRVNEKGYLARKRTIDILVAFNQATYLKDISMVRPGGVVIYESDFTLTGVAKRDDVTYYPVPFGSLAQHHISEIKLKKLLTNMIYVGVLAEVLGIEASAIEAALTKQLRGKEKAIKVNLDAIEVGRKYFKEKLQKQDPYHLERRDKTEGMLMMEGNTASALGCVFGGCTVVAWYPITPASSLAESLSEFLEEHRVDASGKKNYVVIQAEDELAAVGMALGAGWAGARSMTSTSGPGVSLMAEFVGFGYYAEVPTVIFNVQRSGPSTGLPTRTAQGDMLSTATLSHGDTKHVMLIPGDIRECFSMAVEAFDLAERLQTPVFVMTDLDLGMNAWLTKPPEYPTKPFDRGKVLTEEDIKKLGKFERYKDVDGDGICYRTYPGNPHPLAAYFTRGSGHNEAAAYSEDGHIYQRNLERLSRKFDTARTLVPAPVVDSVAGAEVGIIAYGSTDQAIAEARDTLAATGVKTSYMRLRSYPFDMVKIEAFFAKHKKVFVVEQNRDAQMAQLLKLELSLEQAAKMRTILHFSGFPMPFEVIVDGISHKAAHAKHLDVEQKMPEIVTGGE
ncbi:MAG: 2-oxoacid:acceptor oxidoreductase subunit alpha [Elusimicrobiota bacterium]